MQAWMLFAIIAGFKEPVVMTFDTEQKCRTAQQAITIQNNSLGRSVQTGCYVLTPTPEYVEHLTARPLK